MFVLSLIVCYWLVEDYKDEFGFDHIGKQIYRDFKKYIERRCNPKIDRVNLSVDFFNQIIEAKNIYYINHYLIVKSANTHVDGKYCPEGYKLSISKIKYRFLQTHYLLKSLLKPENLICIVLLMWVFCMVCLRIYHYCSYLK